MNVVSFCIGIAGRGCANAEREGYGWPGGSPVFLKMDSNTRPLEALPRHTRRKFKENVL